VDFTILKNISQWEGLSHILWKIKKNVWNHQPDQQWMAAGSVCLALIWGWACAPRPCYLHGAFSMARCAILCDVGWPKLGAKETQDQATSTKWSVELSSYPHFWRSLRGKHFRKWSKLNEMVNAAACILINVFCCTSSLAFHGTWCCGLRSAWAFPTKQDDLYGKVGTE